MVQVQIPTWRSLFDQQQFDLPAAPAGAAHPDTPIFVVVPRQHEGSERQPRREAVSADYLKMACRRDEFE